MRGRAGRALKAAAACGLAVLFQAVLFQAPLFQATAAYAQARVEAHYGVTIAGFPVGSGSWNIDVADDHYTMTINGRSGGFVRMFSSGDGSAAIRGTLHGTKVTPTAYTIRVRAGGKLDEVKMGFAGGAVNSLSVEPPVKPNDKRVPLTDQHKRNVTDPFSAGLIPRAGRDGMGPEACRYTAPIFDGRQRYNLALSYKRMDKVKLEGGYEGPALVCGVTYQPIGGYEPEKAATKVLRNSREMEFWYIPVAGTKFLAVARAQLPTVIGTAVLQATRFTTRPSPRGAAKPRTQ